jgi:hypothetical protein
MIVNRTNDITWQARRGSVAAIIQILNERLARSGVRTRAVFEDGVLQLLCEAQTIDQLERTTLVNQVREILESIAPCNIRTVKINSRIVREQQLLWLDEINRDPENQLLWSEKIILKQPNLFQQLLKDFQDKKIELGKTRPILINNNYYHKSAEKRILFPLSLGFFLLLTISAGYVFIYPRFSWHQVLPKKQGSSQAISSSSDLLKDDIFLEAVRIANKAAAAGKTAKSATQWLEIAANWQRASDLMSQVSPQNIRYKEAQIRTKLYQQYSKAAQQEAEKSKF